MIIDPVDALFLAELRTRELRQHAAAERLFVRPARRRTLARALRRIADRLDPAPLVQRPAL
jgi:hypothetical protein